MLYFCIIAAFFFLLRIGEYAFSGRWGVKKVLTGIDVAPKAAGRGVRHFGAADEMVLWFKGSKTDLTGASNGEQPFLARGSRGNLPGLGCRVPPQVVR